MGHFRLYLVDQIGFSVLCGQSGDLFQCFQLGCLDLFHFLPSTVGSGDAVLQLFLLFLHGIGLAIQVFLLGLQTAFLLGEFRAAFLYFLFVKAALFMNFFPGFHQCFALLALSGLERIVDDAGCLLLGGADLFFCCAFAVAIAQEQTQGQSHQERKDTY